MKKRSSPDLTAQDDGPIEGVYRAYEILQLAVL
jgi:hypothetical protein